MVSCVEPATLFYVVHVAGAPAFLRARCKYHPLIQVEYNSLTFEPLADEDAYLVAQVMIT